MAVTKHRISVDEYDRMVAAGVFPRKAPIELIHGELVKMTPPIGPGHQSEVDRLSHLFHSRLGHRAHIRVQGPLRVGRYSEPEPDLTVLAKRADYYGSGHPNPSDTFLVVEVACSSLSFDREVKAPLYDAERIPECWIVNIEAAVLEVYRRDAPHAPFTKSTLGRGESIAPTAFPDLVLTIEELLGP